jgi:hypothetical protein
VVDFAVVNPTREELLASAVANEAGGATAYEAVKIASYDGCLTDRQVLEPVVLDCFGGFGANAVAFTKKVAYFWGLQHMAHQSVAIPKVFQRIGVCLMRAIAQVILRARDLGERADDDVEPRFQRAMR